VNVVLNGAERELAEGATIADVLELLDAPDRGVAVAIDAEVVPRGEWEGVRLREGARIEVVQAVQGG
jgi:sulfur carrier protein